MLTAQQIKTARDAIDESQAEFAARFGVAQTTVHRWETNGPPRRGAARKAIERVLGELASAPAEAAE